MGAHSSQELETICDSIFSETSKEVSWKWDEQYQALLSEFPCEDREEVISVLESKMDACLSAVGVVHPEIKTQDELDARLKPYSGT
jgi:hypothetical protein